MPLRHPVSQRGWAGIVAIGHAVFASRGRTMRKRLRAMAIGQSQMQEPAAAEIEHAKNV
jgi:hypothetical protein